MLLKLNKELSAMVEAEAQRRAMPPNMLGRLILSQFFMELSTEMAKKSRRAQNKHTGATQGVPDDGQPAEKKAKEPAVA